MYKSLSANLLKSLSSQLYFNKLICLVIYYFYFSKMLIHNFRIINIFKQDFKMLRHLILSLILVSISSANAEVDISGYLDMEYLSKVDGGSEPEFDQHHISVILQHESDIFKALTELEWEHAARIAAEDGGTASGDGIVVVERAWGDINFSQLLNLRLGVILNSTIYQQNHFPSIVVNLTRPQIVKNIFDGSYEGIKLYGKVQSGFNYDAWVTRDPKQRNGGSADTEHAGTSIGSRLGFSRKINRDFNLNTGLLWANYATSSGTDTTIDIENAIGFEAEVNYKNFTLWTEYGERKNNSNSLNNQLGTYSILSYSYYKGMKEIIPYFMYDRYRKNSSSEEAIVRTGLGLTYRPIPTITFKSEYLTTSEYETSTSTVESAKQLGFAFIYFFN